MKTKPVLKGAVAIVFKRSGRAKKFLLLHRVLHWRGWEFPKGGRDGFEAYEKTALRELGEEAGIPAKEVISVRPTRLRLKYVAKSGRPRDLRVFVVEVKSSTRGTLARNPFPEHSNLCWVSAQKALEMLSWTDARKLFEEILNEVR